jgi:hypothetical protein
VRRAGCIVAARGDREPARFPGALERALLGVRRLVAAEREAQDVGALVDAPVHALHDATRAAKAIIAENAGDQQVDVVGHAGDAEAIRLRRNRPGDVRAVAVAILGGLVCVVDEVGAGDDVRAGEIRLVEVESGVEDAHRDASAGCRAPHVRRVDRVEAPRDLAVIGEVGLGLDLAIRLDVRDVRVVLQARCASRIRDDLGRSFATELGGHVEAGGAQVLRSSRITQTHQVRRAAGRCSCRERHRGCEQREGHPHRPQALPC